MYIILNVTEIVYLIVTSCPKSSSYSLTWAMKMAATASYSAVPSILIVAPTGSTNRAIFRSTWQFSSKHFIVMGKVAELEREGLFKYTNNFIRNKNH